MNRPQAIFAKYPNTDLAPRCPFCASMSSDEFEIDVGRWAVACRTCGSIGPAAQSATAARWRWTNRIPPQNCDD